VQRHWWVGLGLAGTVERAQGANGGCFDQHHLAPVNNHMLNDPEFLNQTGEQYRGLRGKLRMTAIQSNADAELLAIGKKVLKATEGDAPADARLLADELRSKPDLLEALAGKHLFQKTP